MRQATPLKPGRPPASRQALAPRYARRRLVALGAVAAVVAVVIVAIAGALSSGSRPARGGGTAGSGPGSGGAALSSTGSHTTTSRTTATRSPAPVAPFRVGLGSLSVLEPGGSAGARALPTVIRYPALGDAARGPARGLAPARAAGPFPLIVFSQGYDYPAEGYAGLLRAWARAGYVVADPTYPDTDPSAPGGPNESDIVNHPRDLSYVITRLLAAAQDPSSRLHGLIDPRRIAIAGQSDGGDVTLATAAGTCCRDHRVKAAVILSGAELAAFGGTYYAAGSPPLLVTQGTGDTINVPGCSAQLYDGAPAPKYYLDLLAQPGQTGYQAHLSPYTTPGRVRDHVAAVVIAFLDRYLKGRGAALTAMRRAGTVPGVMALLSPPSLTGRTTICPGAP
ncbi:MAG TPA: hypothetical protein VFN55_11930 [Solirubrobacteraceae bacterium]|nr:hypothetical protein [Solirubrobacteraceae bacterium]